MSSVLAHVQVTQEQVGNKPCIGVLHYDNGGNVVSPVAGTSVLTNVGASQANQTLLVANAARVGFMLYNDSSSAVDVKLGAGASATSFTKRLLAGDWWTTKDLGVNWTGQIDAVWDSATGTMRVTETSA